MIREFLSHMKRHTKTFQCIRDGLAIRGKIYGDTHERMPVVILCHGFLANQKMCRTYAYLLLEQGYIAVTFDFCGGGLFCKSDGRSRDMTLLSELEDLLAVIGYVEQQAWAGELSLLGCSQGGLVSAMAAKRYPDRFRKLILMYPALCIPDDARKGKMMFFQFDPGNIPEVLGRFPMTIGGEYARTVIGMDVFQEIGGFTGSVLYLHGTEDRVVDIAYARKAKDLYPDCEYHEIIDGGHMFKGESDREACRFLKDFMEAKNGESAIGRPEK